MRHWGRKRPVSIAQRGPVKHPAKGSVLRTIGDKYQIGLAIAIDVSYRTYSETLGPNTGFISVFDVNGNFIKRAITGGNLNSPWGMALAPAGFGIFGGDLLVGNLGDGLINVYDPTTYA
jgi:uncharacterized protein (TIGR03118 family)